MMFIFACLFHKKKKNGIVEFVALGTGRVCNMTHETYLRNSVINDEKYIDIFQ